MGGEKMLVVVRKRALKQCLTISFEKRKQSLKKCLQNAGLPVRFGVIEEESKENGIKGRGSG